MIAFGEDKTENLGLLRKQNVKILKQNVEKRESFRDTGKRPASLNRPEAKQMHALSMGQYTGNAELLYVQILCLSVHSS